MLTVFGVSVLRRNAVEKAWQHEASLVCKQRAADPRPALQARGGVRGLQFSAGGAPGAQWLVKGSGLRVSCSPDT